MSLTNNHSSEETKKCSFCRETKCVAYGSEYFKSIDKDIFVNFRADIEFNQIDCQFGVLDKDGAPIEDTFSDFAIDINYCPVCGRSLEITNFNGTSMECINNEDYEDCLTLGKRYLVRETKFEGTKFQHVIDNNGEHLQTALERFAK